MRQPWCAVVLVILLGMGLIITILPMPADACAVCAGAEDHGYFWGVLFLMSMPFLVGSSIGGWLLYSYRRVRPGLAPSAPNAVVERHTPRPASMSAAADGHNDAAQAHHT